MKLKVYLGNEVIHYEIHSKDSGETCAMCTMSDNIEIMMSSETEELQIFFAKILRRIRRINERKQVYF